jgi:hypothetical protein
MKERKAGCSLIGKLQLSNEEMLVKGTYIILLPLKVLEP